MNKMISKATLVLIPVLLGAACFAQDAPKTSKQKNLVEKREQAEGWYLPVRGVVTTAGEKAAGVTVQVFKENQDMGAFTSNKHGKFDLELDLDFVFTLLIQKPGFQNKMINVDTHLPKDMVQYPAYECFVNLEPVDKTTAADPFYLDFPSAIIRYNEDLGGYYHSETYLQHITNKLQSVAQATF